MTVAESLQQLRDAALVDEDGERVEPQWSPGLDSAGIAAIEATLTARLPDDLRELLTHTTAIDGLLDQITFNGNDGFESRDIFPRGLPIATDGFGNAWVVDVLARPEPRAQIYFACHDAPVVLFQCDGVSAFLQELLRMHTPPHASLIDDVHEDRIFDVWRKNPGVLPATEAQASSDTVVRAFAQTLDPRFLVVDMRGAPTGMGFSWGRFGPQTEVRRHGDERIFAYGKPASKPGLLRRWFA